MALTKWFFKMSFNHWQGPRMWILRPLFLSTPWWSNTNQLFPNTVVNLYPAFLPCCTCGLPSPNLESLWAHNPWFHRSAFQLLVRSIYPRGTLSLEPFVQWRVFLAQVAMPCCMPSNFLKLLVVRPHVPAWSYGSMENEPHSPLQVTAAWKNCQKHG